MSCKHFRHKCPREGTRELYRGLVKQSKLESGRISNERMRLRVLEVLGIPNSTVKIKEESNDFRKKFKSEVKKKDGERRIYNEQNVRKKRLFKEQRKGRKYSRSNQQNGQVPLVDFKIEAKKTPRNKGSTKYTQRKSDDYVWHPLQMHDRLQTGNGSSPCKDVMKHFRNQYHIQGT